MDPSTALRSFSHLPQRPAEAAREPGLRPGERAALAGNAWFASLSATLRHDILRHATVRRHGHGEVIAREGAEVGEWLACAAGCVQLAANSRDGRLQILAFVPPGEWLSEPGLFDGGARTHEARAHGDTTVVSLARTRFDSLLHLHAELPLALLRLQGRHLRLALRKVEASQQATVRQRLARQLVHLWRVHGAAEDEGGLALGLTLQQEQLGRMIGAARQRVNMELKAFERAGLLRMHQGRLLLADERALALIGRGQEEGGAPEGARPQRA